VFALATRLRLRDNLRMLTRGVLAPAVFRGLSAILLAFGLTGCVTRQAAPPVPGRAPAARLAPAPHLGRALEVVPAESLLIVLVYRAGPLAALGHNHVIACHCLTGTVYVPADPLRATFDLRVAVKEFTVDDPALRAAEHSGDFPPDVPQSAREGTRRNMLGAALLDASAYPDLVLQAEDLRRSGDGRPDDVVARMLVQVRGQLHTIAVPLHYEMRPDEIVATGEFPLEQTDLGLTPFSALGGALTVRNKVTIRFRLVAKR
jgi:hypothetical protein